MILTFLLLKAQSHYLPHLPLAKLSLNVLGGFSVLLNEAKFKKISDSLALIISKPFCSQ